MLSIATKFYPIRLLAYMRNKTELDISIENKGGEPYWVEIDVVLPNNVLSLAPDGELQKGRLRVGIVFPRETKSVRCKIYAGGGTYPDNYKVGIVAYGYSRDGAISDRKESKAELRCERIGEKSSQTPVEGLSSNL